MTHNVQMKRTAFLLTLVYFYILVSMEVGGHVLKHRGYVPTPATGHASNHAADHSDHPADHHAAQHPSVLCALMCAVSTGLPATDSPLNVSVPLSLERWVHALEPHHRNAFFASLYARPPPVSFNI